MGTYETSQDIDKALKEVSLPEKKKKKDVANATSATNAQKLMCYRLFDEIANGVLFFGKSRTNNKKTTAEFICRCGEAFRSELAPILSGKVKTCGCKTK